VRVLLISTYELGRQPFGLASPAAWLRAEGHEVTLADLACEPLPMAAAARADFVGFFLPMHTATRLALPVVETIRAVNARAHLCAYGLYASLSAEVLLRAGMASILSGEFEQPLVELVRRLAAGSQEAHARPLVSLARQQFRVPDRAGLPDLKAYARLVVNGSSRRAGYTEASRGCKHVCRHCPVVPVYGGIFRIVQPEVVLEDIRRQVAAGAGHITFGDPDFFNGPGHAAKIVKALHEDWPQLTYDVTIKIEHLLQQRHLLPLLQATGCLFVTSAAESLEDAVLEKFAKGHTRADFIEAVALTRAAGLPLMPTFIPFTPWTSDASYQRFLREIAELDLIEQVAPIQLAMRLLIPEGSLLLDLPEVRGVVGPFDPDALSYRWRSPLDGLSAAMQRLILREERRQTTRREIFHQIWELAGNGVFREGPPRRARVTIPYLTEPWYC
jgi:radical SAM superfamily enzyme YgiQ (UPF0313 family)